MIALHLLLGFVTVAADIALGESVVLLQNSLDILFKPVTLIRVKDFENFLFGYLSVKRE